MSDAPAVLHDWEIRARETLAANGVPIDGLDIEIGVILDLAREAAHRVARPAAPPTTFLLGVAAGRSAADAAAIRSLAEALGTAAAEFEAPGATPPDAL